MFCRERWKMTWNSAAEQLITRLTPENYWIKERGKQGKGNEWGLFWFSDSAMHKRVWKWEWETRQNSAEAIGNLLEKMNENLIPILSRRVTLNRNIDIFWNEQIWSGDLWICRSVELLESIVCRCIPPGIEKSPSVRVSVSFCLSFAAVSLLFCSISRRV